MSFYSLLSKLDYVFVCMYVCDMSFCIYNIFVLQVGAMLNF